MPSFVNDPVKLGMVIVLIRVVLISLDLLKNSVFNFPPDNNLVVPSFASFMKAIRAFLHPTHHMVAESRPLQLQL